MDSKLANTFSAYIKTHVTVVLLNAKCNRVSIGALR